MRYVYENNKSRICVSAEKAFPELLVKVRDLRPGAENQQSGNQIIYLTKDEATKVGNAILGMAEQMKENTNGQ
ncbi:MULTISPECIES: hypothetical protein [Pseudomonadota]|uniref:hypothetical protein n=1 Tax=Pseudomonadota TaxID=1224 RepID=UPI00262D50EB|nr:MULTISPECIES: hypothetical protein [Pseudomonadota]